MFQYNLFLFLPPFWKRRLGYRVWSSSFEYFWLRPLQSLLRTRNKGTFVLSRVRLLVDNGCIGRD